MSRGYWCIVLAAFGSLAAAEPPPRQNSQAEQGQAQQSGERSLQEIASSLKKADDPDVTVQPCEEGEDNRKSDLCAQWKAADAARDGADATWLFGLLGTLIGAATFAAAFLAAKYAKRAADHTAAGALWAKVSAKSAGEAVQSANAAVRQAERQSKRELRAYLAISKAWVKFDHSQAPPEAHLEITNSGQTPAYDVALRAAITVGTVPPETPRFDLSDCPRTIIGNGTPFPVVLHWDDEKSYEPKPGDTVYIRGELRYTDIFRQRWRHFFALESSGPIGTKGVVASKRGNRETRLKE